MLEPVLSNRLLASLVLLVALVLFALIRSGRKELFHSAAAVCATLAKPKVLFPTVAYIVLVVAALVPASRFGVWEPSLWPATALWLLVSGLGLLFRLSEAIQDPGFFRRVILHTVGAVAIVEFIVNLDSFALWIEILAQFLAFVSTAVIALEQGARRQPATKLASAYLVLFVLSATAWGVWRLVSTWSQLDQGLLLREFLMPIWLTPVALVLVYALAVWAAYESAFTRMRFVNEGPLFRQRLALALRCGVRLRNLQRLRGDGAQRVGRTNGFREAWREVGQIQLDRVQEIEAEAAARRRLVENAGLIGTDEAGRQLDEREHSATRESLRWLAICQMGHYRNGERYREDLLPMVEPSFAQSGLPQPSAIVMHVAADGQSWYAERQTITGHWFAVGAAGRPSDQWLFDGPEKPSEFPDEAVWDHWGGGEHSVNWD